MNYNWNWRIFWDVSADGRNTWMMTLVHGLGWTLATSLCAAIIALLLGTIIGVVRNIPLLVQLFLWFFVLPEVLPKAFGDWIKGMTPPWASFVPAVIGLGLFT